jgi:hypothetical protein
MKGKTRFRTPALACLLILSGGVFAITPSAHAQGASISFGKKHDLSIARDSLLAARKLSDFFFDKTQSDSAGLRIKSYFVSFRPKGQRSAGPATESKTDFFSSSLKEQFRAASEGTEIIFDNVKATSYDPNDRSIQLLPTLMILVREK